MLGTVVMALLIRPPTEAAVAVVAVGFTAVVFIVLLPPAATAVVPLPPLTTGFTTTRSKGKLGGLIPCGTRP